MDVKGLLKKLRNEDIHISLNGENLQVSSDKPELPSDLLQEIRSGKAAIISYLKEQGSESRPSASIPCIPYNEEGYVLSSSQYRLWVLSQLEEANVAYNIPGVLVFEGNLDHKALETSYASMVARHESLRTVFRENGQGEIRQVIQSPEASGFSLGYFDLRSEEGRELAVKDLVRKDFIKPFDLSSGPLLRASLYQVEDNKWVFSSVLHHIISDGWSMNILTKELLQFYNAHMNGGAAPLRPLRIHYKDYAAWQQEQLSGKSLADHRNYWLQQFEGELPVLELPSDKPRPAVKTFNGKNIQRRLNAELSQGLKALSQQQGGTLFMGILAAIKALLYRYTGQQDIIVGSPIAGREHVDLQDQIGFYLNTLALRSRFSGEQSFEELLNQVRSVTLDAYEHQVYPFDDLVDNLNLRRDMSRSPLFDVLVVLQNNARDGGNALLSLGDFRVIPYSGGSDTPSKFDLEFEFNEMRGGLHLSLGYNSDIYSGQTVERLIDHLEQLISALVREPKKPIEQLDYLSEAEKHQLLEFNDTAVDYPQDKTIIHLFEEQVEKTPEHIAVQVEDRTLSYRELNIYANQLASCLKGSYGVSTGDLIGIRLERTEWMIIATLAVLKAGGAYVPIDPGYPQERIDYMTSDSGCKLVIDEDLLNDFRQKAGEYNSGNLTPFTLPPSALAYVIYTSGSTGHPKGVMVSHGNLSNFIANVLHRYTGKTPVVMPFIASNAFDISIFQMFTPLLSGGTSLMVDKEDMEDMGRFTELLGQATFIDTVPGVYHLLVNHILENRLQDSFRRVKKVFVGGDAIPDVLLQRLSKAFGSAEIIVMYGPTEGTIFCTDLIYAPGALPADAKGAVIGRPISNVSLYILDRQQKPVPVGVKGEICIAGHGLTKGYLNRPELTAEKYITISLDGIEIPVYRTGDLGRWLLDGTIEFAGRSDHQVKVRGFRIETGEIESVLQSHASIGSAVVAVRSNADGEKELVAYFVAKENIAISELKSHLSAALPYYMVPAHFIQLDELPLTPNGKIDRSKLPHPEGVSTGVEYVAPRNETEEKLVHIWQEILNRERIGVRNNFFDLGGHSLKMTRLASQVHKEFGVKLPWKALFQATVLEDLARLIEQSARTSFASIKSVEPQEDYALSSSQRRLWVLSQFEEANAAYNMPAVYVFEGKLDQKALEAAYASLIERHESLRTIFRQNKQGEVRQVIQPAEASGFILNCLDFRNNENREQLIEDLVQTDFTGPFDLSAGPLLRARLYHVENNKWVFSFVMHHIISDGWSMNVLTRELLQLYSAHAKGEEVSLTPLRIQYKDYSAWQQEQLSGENLQAHKDYWLKQFEGELPVLELSSGKPRPAVKTYNGKNIQVTLDAALSRGLKALSQQQGGTLFMGILAAVNALLHRYTGQQDIIIGSPVAGREHADLENQIGFYLNTLALRSRFSGSDSFQQLLHHVKQVTLDAYEHQVYPFDELVDDLNLRRDMSRSALFDVMVVLQNNETDGGSELQNFDELTVRPYSGSSTEILVSKFDLVFDFTEAGEKLHLGLRYNSDIYDEESMERMTRHLQQLVSAIIGEPQKPIQQLNYLSENEKQQQLFQFNNTAADYPKNKTIVELFEEQAARTPEATAVVFEDKELTYKELNEKANQLASYLKNKYLLKPDDLVGVKLERSEWMIISLLGILKSGAAYLPIDPAYPQERIDYMISDSACKLLIDEALLESFRKEEDQHSRENGAPFSLQPSHLAYVIYTSGSTGRPKGVLVEHRSLVNYIFAIAKEYGIDKNERVLQTTNVAFDPAAEQIFMTLLHGASLYIPSNSLIADGDELAAFAEKNSITHLHSVPSLLRQIAPERIASLKRVVAAGETCPVPLAAGLWDKLRFYNKYGPTEATVSCVAFHVAEQPSGRSIPIGRPLSNYQVYILDERLNLLPLGAAGEICIGGDGVARGYLNRPELTAEKFVENPFRAGERMYRTGDLGRWLPDGSIEFIGRKDEQVKIRGYRIELGEIESALQKHDGVDAAVVITKDNHQEEKELVAYITGEQELNAGALRAWLGGSLPAYMIPVHYVQLDELPLTSNGKVDRKRLPDPEGLGLGTGVEYVAPRTQTEEKLAAIWQDILGKEIVGVKDNFFDLGGHSLKATRLASQVYRLFEVKLSLIVFFENPLLEQQARIIEQSTKTGYIDIEKAPHQEYYPLSSAQKRLFFLQEFAPQSTGYNMPMVNYLGREVDRQRIATVLRQLIARHESLRTSFEKIDGVAMQKIHSHVSFELDTHECLPGEFADYFHYYVRPFNLAQAPLLRSSLVHIKEVGYAWIVDIHHIISDGTSQQVLTDDFLQLYRGDELSDLRLQYRDFSEWQNNLQQTGELEKQKEYWLSRFIGSIPRLSLPTDRPRPSTFSFEGAMYSFRLDKELTAQVQSFGRQTQGTLQMVLLSALNVLFYRYTGQQDITIGCGIAGRRHPDLERIVGMFVNTLAIRNYPEAEKTFEQFYKEVSTACLEAYENQDVQFEDLVDMLQVERDPSFNPIFDVTLVVQNFTRSQEDKSVLLAEGDGNKVQFNYQRDHSTAKFDMSWFVFEQEEDIYINLEYYTAIFDASTIERMVQHFINVLRAAVSSPSVLLAQMQVLSADEQQVLLEKFVDGGQPEFVPQGSLHELFEKQSLLSLDNIALISGDASYTYKELSEQSNQLAHFLISIGLKKGEPVGVLQSRNKDLLVSLLAILKAGGVYVPLDSDYPEERLLYMLQDTGAEVLLTSSGLIELGNRLQWREKGIRNLICVDSNSIYNERGMLRNELMRKDLWDHVGETATDAISAGGWMSSYTGEYISAEEMQEYSENAFLKLKPYLRKNMKVLEIGCSSGLTLFQVAPHVGAYHGTDLSSSILEGTAKEVQEHRYSHITLTCLPAHDIHQLDDEGFDLVIINSVIQSFDGHNYLRDVLVKVLDKMKDTGLLFIGDIMDEDRRQALIDDLNAFREANEGKGYRTKTSVSDELFISREYLDDLIADGIGLTKAEYTGKIYTIPNELTEFRFDALLQVNKQQSTQKQKKRHQYDLTHISVQDTGCLSITLDNSDKAYVIYTSGSTGKPKGVMVTHGNLRHYLNHVTHLQQGNARIVQPFIASASFDISIFQLCNPLLSGGTCLMLEKEDIQDMPRFAALIKNINVIDTVPAVYSLLANYIEEQRMTSEYGHITDLFIGGDAIPDGLLFSLSKIFTGATIRVSYGPTEATIFCTHLAYAAGTLRPETKGTVLGRPIKGTSIYITSENAHLVPIGVTGEICIGGPGVAKGYLNKPDLTAENFVENPFSKDEVLYRTGDLGRWLPDGNIEFMGRKDNQVKIRGYRIELGEIENVLRKHSSVKEAVVVKTTREGDHNLVAFVVGNGPITSAALRSYLGKLLPAYMVPAHFVQLESLPLTPNGKVDRKKLHDPNAAVMASGTAYVASRTPTEEKLAQVWQELLGKENIGAKDNFFESGGHSLKATRLTSLIQKLFEVSIELKEIFLHPVLEDQARLIDQSSITSFVAIPVLEPQADYILSSSQRRLWVLSQLEEANAAYNMPGVYVFEGNLDYTALEVSYASLVERHESLRTIFRENGQGEVRQVIQPAEASGFTLVQLDLRNDQNTEQSVKDMVRKDFIKPFDLSSGPLLRASLYQIENNKWVFSFVMHHIISDGWSMNILVKELLQFYSAYTKGEGVSLTPLRIHYKDYAAWQQEQLSGDSLVEHRNYWLQQFEGELPVLELPSDKPRPGRKTFNGKSIQLGLNAEVSQGLKALSQQQGGTLFMGILAAVNALLYRYTGQQDIIIGSPIAGREHVDLQDQIGFYLNTLALRSRFSGSNSFRQLLDHVKQITLDAFAHQVYPFDDLVDNLNLRRDLSRSPLFDVLVVLQNNESDGGDALQSLGDLHVSPYSGGEIQVSKFDLEFGFTEMRAGLHLSLGYNTDIYSEQTIERLVHHLEQLISALVREPQKPIEQLEYLSEADKQQLLEFNNTSVDYPKDTSIIHLFEEQVEKTPEYIALQVEGRALSYKELNRRANQLASCLKESYQVSPGDFIGIRLKRSEWMVVATLAVLKAGGAYVPIDPEYPQERIDYMISDSGCKLVIGEEELATFRTEQDLYSDRNLELSIDPENLAYIIYTSGSTGQPKGVMARHSNLSHFFANVLNRYAATAPVVMPFIASNSFDISIFQMFTPLLSGGTSLVMSKEDIQDMHRFAKLLDEATYIDTVPAVYHLLANYILENKLEASFRGVEKIFIGGDSIPDSLLQRLSKSFINASIVVTYGPTEGTIFCTDLVYAPGALPGNAKGSVIGRPIGNVSLYILDRQQRLVPLGVKGEICIAGHGLTKGYLNRPELTSEKFVSINLNGIETPVYRTGDLGRWLPNGTIEFAGRSDHQVKVRGFRIEIGEIESVLQAHASIDSAIVVVRSNADGEKDLVAYFVSREEVAVSELKAYLGAALPYYMVPAHIIQLNELPLTPNGKIDRSRLPHPEDMSTGVEYVAPRNETEEKLVHIWKDILSRERISVKDNFFDLGGHSLKASRLASQVHRLFEVKLSLIVFFENPILEQQARIIEQSTKTGYIDIEKAEHKEYYPLSSAQKRLFFLQEFAPQSTGYNMPMVNYLGREVDRQRIATALRQLIARHESLRTSFEKIDGVVMQKIHSYVSFELGTHECLPGEFPDYVYSYIRPFDLSQAPLLRSSLVHIKEVGYAWIVDIHHIISDGTSQQVLTDDFLQLYRGDELSDLRLQYRDFSEWQNNLQQSGELEKQKEYWLSRFTGSVPRLSLPTDRPRPSTFSFEGAMYSFRLDKELTAQVQSFGRQTQGTLQMVLLSALNVLFYRYSGQQDITIGCGIAGRRHPDLERIVGMFVNTLAIRNYPEAEKTFEQFYKEVSTACLEAYENQDVQFEDLVDMLQVERDPSFNPIFDVTLVVQNFTRSQEDKSVLLAEEGGNNVHFNYQRDHSTAKFDMSWFVFEQEEDIYINLEYYTAIFDASTIERMVQHFINVLRAAVSSPSVALAQVQVLSADEQQVLLEKYVDGGQPGFSGESLHELFEKQSLLSPDNVALISGDASYTYKEINDQSNQLAHFLISIGLKKGDPVGVLQSRNKDLLVSLLAILKAGGVYVPLDSDCPEERLLYMLQDTGAEVLLTSSSLIELGNRLQWREKGIRHLICVDSNSIYTERGMLRNELMRKDLWDHVGETATDAISAGGWMSSYTGEYISAEEMQEYSENAFLKLKPYLHKDMKVLEIGCSSGLTLFQVAPHVGAYHGTDLSTSILEGTRKEAAEKGYTHITLTTIPAHDIHQLDDEGFDLVIINSVIQSFDGHNYLRDVLVKVLAKMKDTGLLFIGDIMDEDRRQALIDDLNAFREANEGKGYRTKTSVSDELFISREYLDDLVADGIGLASAEYTGKIYTIPNELTEFRFDALLQVDKQQSTQKQKKRHQYDLTHISAKGTGALNITPDDKDTAYVIYTSGSTGKPKGVMVAHSNIAAFLDKCSRQFGSGGAVTMPVLASNAFDISLFETFLPLITGGTVMMLDISQVKDTAYLLQQLKLATAFHAVPALMAQVTTHITESGTWDEYAQITDVYTGGDAVPTTVLAALHTAFPQARIHVLYGPTESTIFVTSKLYNPGQEDFKGSIIGSPNPHARVYITDASGQLAPVGVAGEICIGGSIVSKGYLNQPDLTAEKFVADPFHKGVMIYRSGDLGRWLPDGGIEFLGRKDNQVKIRGYRIELGEVENALRRHSSVQEAVLVKTTREGDHNLVAYVVSNGAITTADLRNHLGKSLPAYMVPAHFVQLEALPLTSNGKVDRKKLPDPNAAAMASGTAYVAPRTSTEERLAFIWQELLGREKIGAKDNFFESGGHSLKATRLTSHIQKVFEVSIELKDIFLHPVLENQARLIDQSSTTSFVAIPVLEEQADYVLSSSQRRLWVLGQFEEENAAYNMPGVYMFEGELNYKALENSYASLIERHESLRTVFRENEQGEVRQVIQSPEASGFSLVQLDLRNDQDTEQSVKDLVREDFAKPFDLSGGSLLRAGLYQIEDNKWVFSFVMHHIISDGWSMNILIKELLQFYSAHAKGETLSLPPLRIHYKDYAAWQQQQLTGENLKAHKDYWLQQFSGELPVLELASDKPRPASKTFNGKNVYLRLNSGVSQGLKAYSQQQGGTLFMGIIAAVNALLYRYTGQQDIIIGSPIAGREHIDLQDQIGFYLNTLALRSRFSGSDSFRQLLDHVKGITLDAYEHQVYPFDDLVDNLNLRRDLSRSVLFDVLVALQNNERDGGDAKQNLNGLRISPYGGGEIQVSKFDLEFNFTETGEELHLGLGYNCDIYSHQMMERLVSHLEHLISAVVREPMKPIAQLEYLGAEEKQQLLSTFNDTSVDYPKDKTIVHLFEEQVEKTPEHIALQVGDRRLSYKELNRYANQLASCLRETYGVSAGDLVGIKLERTEWMVIATLAVLKAGAAYVPIDIDYPQDRVVYMTADSGCRLVINDELLNDFRKKREEYSRENLTPYAFTPSSLAYIIYTSGSTGRPKGVMVTHGNLSNFFANVLHRYTGKTPVVMPFIASNAFDISIFHLFTPLLSGGTSVMVTREQFQDMGRFTKLLSGATFIDTVPGVYHLLVNHILENNLQGSFSGVEKIFIGGDAVPDILLQRLAKVFCNAEIIAIYGPTEGTVFCTDLVYAPGTLPSDAKGSVIGRPISNVSLYILDEQLVPVPLCVKGEVCIAGHGLTKGYLNRPELTAEKYVTIKLDGIETPVYRTGDLGKWTADGTIEFAGRKDSQVKIRGFRIETGEIESLLQAHASIDSAVVTVRSNADGEKELAAYIVSREEVAVTELRTYLGAALPHYMVPAHFVKLDALPLTPNGKIDHKALPAPESAAMQGVPYVAPRNEAEKKMVLAWQEALGKEKIGIRDNFFDLGGHSLKAMKLQRLLNKDYGFRVSIRDIYNYPTIEELVAATPGSSKLVRLGAGKPDAPRVYMLPPTLGNSILFKPLADLLPEYNCYGLQYSGLEKDEPLYTSLQQAAEEFCAEIMKKEKDNNFVLLGYSMGALIAFEMVKILEKKLGSIPLVLLDRPPVNAKDPKPRKEALSKDLDWLVEKYKSMTQDTNIDEKGLRRFLEGNTKLLMKYKQKGKIKSNIQALESVGEKTTSMKDWEQYTEGKVVHQYLRGDHWQALFPVNLLLIEKAIRRMFR